jgi:hypothetical protein
MTNDKATREQVRQQSGQFGHALVAVCKCGKTKGAHLAARPFPMGDDTCDGFKAAKSAK